MKLLWLMIATVLVAVFSIPILTRMLDDGLESLRDSTPDETRGEREQGPRATSKSGSIYRWRDARGVLHIESSPPLALPYEEIKYEHQPVATSMQASENDAPSRETSARQTGPSHPLSVYTSEGVQHLLDEAEQTAKRIDARRKALDDLKRDL